MEVDQGRVISFAISMTFTLIANISSVKAQGHVNSSSGWGGGWVEFKGVGSGGGLIVLDASAVSIS